MFAGAVRCNETSGSLRPVIIQGRGATNRKDQLLRSSPVASVVMSGIKLLRGPTIMVQLSSIFNRKYALYAEQHENIWFCHVAELTCS